MVLSGLKNQSQYQKGLTVPSPNLNTQRKAKCGKPLSCCSPPLQSMVLFTPLKPQSRNRERIPVLPPSSSKATGKGQRRGRALDTVCRHTELGGWEWPQNLQHQCDAGEPGAAWRAGMRAPGTRGSGHGGSCPTGCAGTGQAKECLASPPRGGRKIVHIIFCRLQAKSYSFYLRKLFQAIDLSNTTHMGKGNKNLAS